MGQSFESCFAKACFWCGCLPGSPGRKGRPAVMTREHLVPRSANGSSLPDNLVVACHHCNSSRGMAQGFAVIHARNKYSRPRSDVQHNWNLALYAKWVALEKEKMGWSPCEAMKEGRLPVAPPDQSRPARKVMAKKRAKYKAAALAYSRWEDDGGRVPPECDG